MPENLTKLFWLFNATADNQYAKVNQQDAQLNAFFVGDKGGNDHPLAYKFRRNNPKYGH
jgi:hypothetical protein